MTPDERAAWLERRRAGIGASDVAAMVHGTYGGMYAVVADKLGHDVDLGDNMPEKARGLAWEQRIADAVQAVTGLYVVGEQFEAKHQDHPHRMATIDGFLATQPTNVSLADVAAVLEEKTVGEFADMHWDRWSTQVAWQMHVADVDRALVVAAKMDTDPDGNETIGALRFRWIERDRQLEQDLIELAELAWMYVQCGQLPDPDSPTALDYVNRITGRANPDRGDVVDLDDIGDLVARFGEIKAALKAADDERRTIEARIKHRLGDATKGATSTGWRISYSKNSNVLDAAGEEAVLLAHPEFGKTVLDKDRAKAVLGKDLDGFRSPIGARRITITPPKETS